MNKLKHKPNLDAQMREHEMPEYQGKWRNHIFRKSGGSFLGEILFDTKEAAASRANLIVSGKFLKANGKIADGLAGKNGESAHIKDVLYVFQIPVAS